MDRQVSSVIGLLIVVAASILFGFILLRPGSALDDAYQDVPRALIDYKTLKDSLREQEN